MDKKHEDLIDQLRSVISKYLDDNVKKPSLETVEKDFDAQDHLASLLGLINNIVVIVNKEGLAFDKDFLKTLPKEELEKRIEALNSFIASQDTERQIDDFDEKEALEYLEKGSSKKYLMPYLTREINWIVISILSASYVSSLILMRSVFELTIGITTRLSGSMSEKIDSITFFGEGEKKNIKKLWYRLCAWGHPYGKWLKEVCPIYTSHQPIYHPKLCTLCVNELTNIIDLFLVVVMFKYEIDPSKVQEELKKLGADIFTFELLRIRISA